MKNILISGPNGFVGTNITAYLRQYNYNISGLSRVKDQTKIILSQYFNWDELQQIK